jgi:hypothetical protein
MRDSQVNGNFLYDLFWYTTIQAKVPATRPRSTEQQISRPPIQAIDGSFQMFFIMI